MLVPLILRQNSALTNMLSPAKQRELGTTTGTVTAAAVSGSGADSNAPEMQTTAAQTPGYSVILFGPPGTAKTTICGSMASYLGNP